ncbi:MAG: DUF3553 domain-containing protein [Desulfobulbaceae bacterium]|nr:DUF3553 domain-containing protein [Desulfobulbaceae bacterium]
MKYSKGERVKHPTMDDWGLGDVLCDSNGKTVRVFFVGAGEKTLVLEYVQPIKITGDESIHPLLDNIKNSPPTANIKYQSLPQLVKLFLKQFPDGFHGQKYIEEEREYKDKAHMLALELIGKPEFDSLLTSNDYQEITKRALKVVNAANLIFPNEKMSLKDGLLTDAAQKDFSLCLYELLFGEADVKLRFEGFLKMLEEINAAKWTTVSYLLFILRPEKYMFVKPKITQYSSEVCGYEINYKPQLNWRTYKSVLDFSNYLFIELSELKPRDMIDIQSFMWCIAPGKR